MSANRSDRISKSFSLLRANGDVHDFTGNGNSGARDVAIIPLTSGVTKRPKQTFQQKVALIAGGGNEDGLELARALAQRGADVTIVDLASREEMVTRISAEVEAIGQRCLAILATEGGERDDQAFARHSVDRIVNRFGRLDIFIDLSGQNASAESASISEMEQEQLRAQIFPSFNLMKAALDEILK